MHIHWLYDKIDELVNVEKKTDISNGMNMFWVLDGDLILWLDDSLLSGSGVLNVQLPIIQFQLELINTACLLMITILPPVSD